MNIIFGEVNERFAERLRDLREAAGLTQKQLADKLGVSRGSISYYENCERVPDIIFLEKTAYFYGVSTDYLLGLTDVKTQDASLRAVCEYTGLSETTIHSIKNNRCSLCGYSEYDQVKYTRFKYCPNCGAKMDLED